MKFKAIGIAVLCLAMGTALTAGLATAEPGNGTGNGPQAGKGKKKGKTKVTICHRRKNAPGSYVRIRVGKPAVKAHVKHGDKFPGDAVPGGTLGADCSVTTTPPPPQPTRFTSTPMDFGPNGWGGWSCPAGQKAVGGGHTLTDVAAEGIAQPGATIGGSTYPTFPHYVFPAGETGYVVQNDDDAETGVTVFVDCVPV